MVKMGINHVNLARTLEDDAPGVPVRHPVGELPHLGHLVQVAQRRKAWVGSGAARVAPHDTRSLGVEGDHQLMGQLPARTTRLCTGTSFLAT
jgi:hypothetical protein